VIVVQKYGGSSVKDLEHLRKVAGLVKARVDEGARVCVVVSAMGDTTDELLARAKKIAAAPPRRELDMLLTAGERVSMALLAMALHEIGVDSISFTGSQSGIITNDDHANARIVEVRPYRVQDELEKGRVVIVGGFQGVSYKREVTTLGRGGSDTTAVALAAALDAEACEIYSDVDGVYSADPRVVEDARKIDALSHQEMQELAAAGAKVLNAQAVEFAKEKGIALYARKTGSDDPGTVIRRDAPPAPGAVRGVAHKARYHALSSTSEALGALIAHLEACRVKPVQVIARAGQSFVLVDPDDAHGFEACADSLPEGAERQPDYGAVSLIGQGALEADGLITKVIEKLGGRLKGLSTSRFRVTALVDPAEVEQVVRELHEFVA
jgi:aspartate kinase